MAGRFCSPHVLNEFEKQAIRENGGDPDDYVAINAQPAGPEGVAFVDMGSHYIMVVQAPIPKRMFPAMQKSRILLQDGSQQANASLMRDMGAIPCVRIVQKLSGIDYEQRQVLARFRDAEGRDIREAGLEDAQCNPINRKPAQHVEQGDAANVVPMIPPTPPPPKGVPLNLPQDIAAAAERAATIPRPFFDAMLTDFTGASPPKGGPPDPAHVGPRIVEDEEDDTSAFGDSEDDEEVDTDPRTEEG